MLIKTNANGFNCAPASEITNRAAYDNRRDILKWMATGLGSAMTMTINNCFSTTVCSVRGSSRNAWNGGLDATVPACGGGG